MGDGQRIGRFVVAEPFHPAGEARQAFDIVELEDGDGEHRPFRYVSAWNLIGAQAGHAGMAKNGLEEEWFKDKIMLVGGTSAGIYDLKSLPVSDQSPGNGGSTFPL